MIEEQLVIVDSVSKKYDLDFRFQQNFGEYIFNRSPKIGNKDDFYALKNISFNIAKGNVLGVIGRNGAGKSTLLRLLSGITKPTSGEIVIRGSVTSILDIGTGFHPDLTGRENIKMVSELHGYSKEQFGAIADKVLSFSDIGDFVNIPVKYYSSGMFLRLAFSTAINFLSDVIVLDEVMAVGDAKFQKKCLTEIQRLRHEDRTIIMVSHSMNTVSNYCNLAMCLEKGEIVAFGEVSKVLRHYITEQILGVYDGGQYKVESQVQEAESDSKSDEENSLERDAETEPIRNENTSAAAQDQAVIKKIKSSKLQLIREWNVDEFAAEDIAFEKVAITSGGSSKNQLRNDEEISIEFTFTVKTRKKLRFAVNLRYQLENQVMTVNVNKNKQDKIHNYDTPGKYVATCNFPPNFFNTGLFTLDAFFTDIESEIVAQFTDMFHFYIDLTESNSDPSDLVHYLGDYQGPLAPEMEWKSIKVR